MLLQECGEEKEDATGGNSDPDGTHHPLCGYSDVLAVRIAVILGNYQHPEPPGHGEENTEADDSQRGGDGVDLRSQSQLRSRQAGHDALPDHDFRRREGRDGPRRCLQAGGRGRSEPREKWPSPTL